MNTGKRLRLNKLFRDDGRTFIVAIDHPTYGEIRGLERLKPLVKNIKEGGVDGFLANPGAIVNVLNDLSNTGLIMTVPYMKDYVKYAAKIGVDAIKTAYFGNPKIKEDDLEKISMMSAEAEEWGIPYILELIPIDENGKYMYNPDILKVMCRIGAELGADVIKTVYAGPPEKFIDVIETSGVPIIIAGGEKMSSTTDFIKTIWEAIKAGASGAAIGRNVWQSSNPRLVASTVWKIIHNRIDLNNALETLGV
jgi:DhnA family fructose-bisphosphate aldolase class Ia